jgi:hypothetical protein
LARERYRAEHPTEIIVLKCMDGRIHIPVATKTPLGIIQPFRNLGGIFDLGWPHLGEVLSAAVHRAVAQGRRVLILITYHFSRGSPHRGCAGFDYDQQASIAFTYRVREQVEQVFGAGHQTVQPVICGFETDEDALLLHGEGGEQLNLAEAAPLDDAQWLPRLQRLYPSMPQQMVADIMPLIVGNIEHIAEVRQSDRQPAIEHREWMICVGRGFDFLHVPNVALIVGPYSPELSEPIGKAAAIIAGNMAAGRIPDDGFLLLASSPYDEVGSDRARAVLKSRFLAQFSAQVIRRQAPELAARMVCRTAVLSWHTRGLEFLA